MSATVPGALLQCLAVGRTKRDGPCKWDCRCHAHVRPDRTKPGQSHLHGSICTVPLATAPLAVSHLHGQPKARKAHRDKTPASLQRSLSTASSTCACAHVPMCMRALTSRASPCVLHGTYLGCECRSNVSDALGPRAWPSYLHGALHAAPVVQCEAIKLMHWHAGRSHRCWNSIRCRKHRNSPNCKPAACGI